MIRKRHMGMVSPDHLACNGKQFFVTNIEQASFQNKKLDFCFQTQNPAPSLQHYWILHIFQGNLRQNLHIWPECDSINYTKWFKHRSFMFLWRGSYHSALQDSAPVCLHSTEHLSVVCARNKVPVSLLKWRKRNNRARLGELDESKRRMWDTCATGLWIWKTHPLSKRISLEFLVWA